MRFLEPADVRRLADAIGPHFHPLVLTASYVGLRWGELAGLKVKRVDLLRRTIRVEEQLVEVAGSLSLGPPKTRAGIRTVTMPASLVDVLAPHFATPAVQGSGLAFPTPTGRPMRRSSFRRTFRRACVSAGFEPKPITGEPTAGPSDAWPLAGLVFHELRHTAAALAIAAGAHPMAIKERLGHSSITVTLDRYGHRFPRLEEAIAERLDGVLRESLAAPVRPEAASVVRLRRSGALVP